MNYTILNNRIITSQYVIDLLDEIKKSDDDIDLHEQVRYDLFNEFSNLILQGKITFGFVYTDNEENKLRGRVGNFSGFRTGTQKFKLIPNNKLPKEESKEPTCLRYWDFGRSDWRSFKKDLFIVATSFYNDEENKWYDDPEKAGFKSKFYNTNGRYKRVERKDTLEEKQKRDKINLKEETKRETQIQKELKRRLKLNK
jgi:hypothetical protein